MVKMYERTIEYSNLCLSVHYHKIKLRLQSQFLVLIHHASNAIKVCWYSSEVKNTFEDLEDDLKKDKHKFRALIRRFIYP